MMSRSKYWCELTHVQPNYLELRFNFAMPTANKWKNKHNHYWVYNNYKKRIERCLKNGAFLKRKKCFKLIEIIRINTRKIRDENNLIGGCQPLLDAIRDIHWIVDDDYKNVKIKYYQAVGTPETIVKIIDIK